MVAIARLSIYLLLPYILLIGCMDDRGIQQSTGQRFMTTDGRQCFCGKGGSISCDSPNNESISNGKLNIN